MPCTDLSQPINRKEALAIQSEIQTMRSRCRTLMQRLQGNGHDDAPDLLDDCLTLMSSAVDSINYELDQATSEAA